MQAKIEDVDAWVIARIGALERANRRLWIGVAASFTTLVALAVAGAFFAAQLEFPEGAALGAAAGGALRVDDLEVHRGLRLVDDQGRTVISLGLEAKPSGGADQAVLGLFAAGARKPEQTLRIATSPLGSALSLSSVDGNASASLYAGRTGVSLELRRGSTVHVLNELSEPVPAAAPAVAAPEPARAPAAARGESDALAAREVGAVAVDLTNPTLQALGGGFFVGPTSVTDSGAGLRVRGRIVNATSVDQARAEFRLALGRREVAFTVARVAAGGSAPFAVELVPGGKADVRAARMRWTRSSMSYSED